MKTLNLAKDPQEYIADVIKKRLRDVKDLSGAVVFGNVDDWRGMTWPDDEQLPAIRVKHSRYRCPLESVQFNISRPVFTLSVFILFTAEFNIAQSLCVRLPRLVTKALELPDDTGDRDGLIPESFWGFIDQSEGGEVVVDPDAPYSIIGLKGSLIPPQYGVRIDLPIWFNASPTDEQFDEVAGQDE